MKLALSISLCLILLFTWDARAASRAELSALEKALAESRSEDWMSAYNIAKQSNNNTVQRLIWWVRVKAKNTDANFGEIQDFLLKHPDWPDRDTILTRAERALSEAYDTQTRRQWFEQFPPKTSFGVQLYAYTLLESNNPADRQKATDLIRDAWRKLLVDEDEQDSFLNSYASFLRPEDHIEAVSNMIWKDDVARAQASLRLVDEGHRHLFNARLKFRRNMSGMEQALRTIPQNLQNDDGLAYDRLSWRHERDMDNGALELLKSVSGEVSHPEEWWEIRRLYVWDLIENNRYQDAYNLLKDHGQKETTKEFAESEWLSGWILYAYLNNPGEAYKHFYKLYHGTLFPVSKSRGAYWAGKASAAHGDKAVSAKWMGLAATYPSTYYGQLALAEISQRQASLPPPIAIPKTEYEAFKSRPLVQAVTMLDEIGEETLTKNFLMHMVNNARNDLERAMSARLILDLGRVDLAVKVAKEATKYNTVLSDIGYPIIKYNHREDIEFALTMAVTRQESEFRNTAKSQVGALGLMQVMPATAKATAKKMGINFSLNRMNEQDYNLQIGSAYLADLVEQYDGSYIMAVAAYNAGPGRVAKWRKEFGDPRQEGVDPILWVERIPITETRNYVQRVMENLQMYRHRLNDYKPAPMKILEDLKRG